MAIHSDFKRDWLSTPKTQFLAVLLVTFALRAGAVGFSDTPCVSSRKLP